METAKSRQKVTKKVRIRRFPTVISVLIAMLSACSNQIELVNQERNPESTPFAFETDSDPVLALQPFSARELLVQPFPGVEEDELEAVYTENSANPLAQIPELGLTVLEVAEGDLQRTAGALMASGLIEGIHKNYIFEPSRVPNDPNFMLQPHLPLIRGPEAWDVSTGSDQIIIAIVDTGVDADHPDLTAKLLAGWNVYDENGNSDDVQGHGTLVAGTAAALSDNSSGVSGVAWDCPILPVRAGDREGRSTSRHIAAGILWAVGHRARVINVSFAPLWSDRIVQSAAEHAFLRGAVVVISAGNGGTTVTAEGYREALFVGAVDDQSQIAAFSDRGPFVDLVAPGVGIFTTDMGGGYRSADGTSFAAPIVTGVVALSWSTNPDLRPVTIVDALLAGVRKLSEGEAGASFGRGEVDAFAAVRQAASTPFMADMTAPTLQISRPREGESLSGKYAASVTATDASGVSEVTLAVDGVSFASDAVSPYRFLIDAAQLSSGSHEFAFTAHDAAGNASPTRTVNVTVSGSVGGASTATATGITFTSPAAGAMVTGSVTIRATVTDADGLSTIEWFVDGESVLVSRLSGTRSGVSYFWRTSGQESGSHAIAVVVTDTTGQRSTGRLELVKR